MLLNDQPLSHQNTSHISSKVWTSFGKISLPKKIIIFLQSRHYLTSQSRIGQSIRSEEVEKNLDSRIAFQKFVTLWFIGHAKMLLSSKEKPNVIEVVLTTTSLTHKDTLAFHDFNPSA